MYLLGCMSGGGGREHQQRLAAARLVRHPSPAGDYMPYSELNTHLWDMVQLQGEVKGAEGITRLPYVLDSN